MAGRCCPQPSSPWSLSEPSAQPWSAEVPDHTSGSCFQSRREKTPAKNGSFWLRTAATLYGGIKRLMDPGQWRLITSLEEQITPFSADPALLARAVISKLWKKQLERESSIWQQSGARTDFQRSNNLKSAWQKVMTRSQTPLTTLSVSLHKSVDFAEHAVRPTNINVDISAQTTKLLAQHLPGIHQSKSHT